MTEVTSGDTSAGALEEFRVLRNEILAILQTLQQLLVFQLTVTGAILSFSLLNSQFSYSLLFVPVTSFILFAHYRAQYSGLDAISKYVQTELAPRVPGGLGWEDWRRINSRQGPRSTGDWILATSLAFPGIALAALAWSFPATFIGMAGGYPTSAWIVYGLWTTGALLTLASMVQAVRFGIHRRRPLQS
jgi:hypothetical protein